MFGIADYGAFVAAIILFLAIPGPGNLALITSSKFNGYDPESTSQSSQFGQNMTFYSYPRARTFTIGCNVTF